MKKMKCSIVIAVLLTTMVGCGNTGNAEQPLSETSTLEKTETTEEAKIATTIEETSEEAEPECEHKWIDATYSTPKTCEICGITEGEPRMNYFEEKSIPISPSPTKLSTKLCYWDKDDTSDFIVLDGTLDIVDWSTEEADKDYNTVTISVKIQSQLPYRDVSWHLNWDNDIYDLYSGTDLPGKDMPSGDDSQKYSTEVEFEGETYTIEYTKENIWNDWVYHDDGNGNQVHDMECTQTYVFKVPKGYDGLVYTLGSSTKPREYSDEIDETVSYAQECYEEGGQFFRIQ